MNSDRESNSLHEKLRIFNNFQRKKIVKHVSSFKKALIKNSKIWVCNTFIRVFKPNLILYFLVINI